MPLGKSRRLLRAIISAVDFDGSQLARSIFELALFGELFRIETLVPLLKSPATDTHTDFA